MNSLMSMNTNARLRAFATILGYALSALFCLAQTPPAAASKNQPAEYATTVAYVEEFYPLWFTHLQSQLATRNRMAGPDRISPLYKIVVAINDDTLYASTFIDLTEQPLMLSVPATTTTYSVLTLDPYGQIFESGIPAQTNGFYVLTGPGYAGPLPPEATHISMPLNLSVMIFRADKYSPSGSNMIAQAESFRLGLTTQPLCAYWNQQCPDGTPEGGSTLIVPEIACAEPVKSTADTLIAVDPIKFLQQLQTAVLSSNTPPFTPGQKTLSDTFNLLFGDGTFDPHANDGLRRRSNFSAGARDAHTTILNNYLTHLGPTYWINFTNFGNWGDAVIDRAGVTEFLQYGNDHSTAAYYHAFRDSRGVALTGVTPRGYVITFPPDQIPAARRFWSITAYTPDNVELVSNPINKYEVASYTPGLSTNADGSLSFVLATRQPADVPVANWLPIPSGKFNVMLRVYGPEGSVEDATYIPPAVQRRR